MAVALVLAANHVAAQSAGAPASAAGGFHPGDVGQRLMQELYRIAAAAPLLLLSLVIVWVAWLVGGWLSRRALLDRAVRRNPFLRELAGTTVRWLVVLIGLLIALEIMQATALVGAVLGGAGVLGVVLGFAFKDILENYLAGILMSVRQPFAPRDHVVIDGNEGVVVSMTSRATTLMTLDGNHLRLPNALVFRSVILNYSRNPTRRFECDVGVGVGEDLVEAQQLGVAELKRLDGVLETPPPRAYIVSLGDSSVQVRFNGWVDQRHHDFLLAKSEAIRRVKLALEEAGMDLPEPIYRVQLSTRAQAPTQQPTPIEATERAEATIDTRVQTDLDPQIEHDQRTRGNVDLLDPSAPRE